MSQRVGASGRMKGVLGALGLVIAAALVPEGVPVSFAQGTPCPLRRHLEPQTYDQFHPHGAYLGQRPPGLIPRVFGPGFISSTRDEYSICFSPDRNEIHFSRLTQADGSNTIWVTRQVDGVWTYPVKAPFTGRYYNSEPFVTRDNAKMYFVSIRNGGPNNFQIWTMDRVASGWSTPTQLGQPFSTNIKMFPTVATNGNLYFSEVGTNTGRFLMARYAGGQFEPPVPLSATVNAFPFMGHAFVAPDESWLVFDAVPGAPESSGGVLYVSFKGAGNDWLPPIRLNLANMTDNELCPAISPDGKYLFFTRRNGEHDDIWWVDSRVVFDLRSANQRGARARAGGGMNPDDSERVGIR